MVVTGIFDGAYIYDIFVVRPGESIPADGIIIEGSSAVNKAALTGESIFRVLPGNGLRAVSDSDIPEGGSRKFIGDKTKIPMYMSEYTENLSNEGKIPLFFSVNSKLTGIIALCRSVHIRFFAALRLKSGKCIQENWVYSKKSTANA